MHGSLFQLIKRLRLIKRDCLFDSAYFLIIKIVSFSTRRIPTYFIELQGYESFLRIIYYHFIQNDWPEKMLSTGVSTQSKTSIIIVVITLDIVYA